MSVFYRLLPGDIDDKQAFENIVLASELKDGIIIADKSFYSKENVSFLMNRKLKYILPKYITEEFLAKDEKERYEGVFAYNNKAL